jgi:hypothetical protein
MVFAACHGGRDSAEWARPIDALRGPFRGRHGVRAMAAALFALMVVPYVRLR